MQQSIINEKLLTFIWQNKLFGIDKLVSTTGEKIEVLNTGYVNKMSGPDIYNAQVRIDEIIWTGNIEIHVKSSHWYQHGHHNDHAYDNIILHIVYEDDTPLVDKHGNKVSTLIIKPSDEILERYQELTTQNDTSKCPAGIFEMNTFNSLSFTTRLAVERLEYKAEAIRNTLTQNTGNWIETFWQFLARSFGFGKNALPFELTAKSLPYNIITKNSDSFVSVLALLYGQAGFLFNNKYKGSDAPILLQEYNFLKSKYNLSPIDPSIWKYSGMRPQNSPFVRIRQLASITATNEPLFSRLIECNNIDDALHLFHIPHDSPTPQLGTEAMQLLVINLVCPFLVCYGKYTDNYTLLERAVDFLEKLPAEKNSLVLAKKKAGFCVQNAYDSQSLIQLHTMYCTPRKCIECQVGRYYISDIKKTGSVFGSRPRNQKINN